MNIHKRHRKISVDDQMREAMKNLRRTIEAPHEEKFSVDYILVYKRSSVDVDAFQKIDIFSMNLELKGFLLEEDIYSENDNVNIIKIHAPRNVLLKFADIFRIDLAFQNAEFRPSVDVMFKCMATEILVPDATTKIYEIASSLVDREVLHDFTSAEKNLVIYKVLTTNQFGLSLFDVGIEKLKKKGVFEDAYPLHDGDYTWPTDETAKINDRQLLLKYWASFKCWHKQQPLDLVERYFGSEVAFYFAWVGVYNKMLAIASIAGFISFILGVGSFKFSFGDKRQEICNSNKILCPRCHTSNCKFEFVNASCVYAFLLEFIDNPVTVSFATLMCLWATLFMEIWRREESVFRIRWNLRRVETDMSMRPEYEEKTKYRSVSLITGKVQPYTPFYVACLRYTVTYSAIFLLIILMCWGIFGVMLYVKTITTVLTTSDAKIITKNTGMIASSTGSVLSVLFILLFDQIYHRTAIFLTDLENPRTQTEYDNSYAYKSYAMAFINNYAVIFYIAFLKGKFYTYPGDVKLYETLSGMPADICGSSGCIMDLATQLVLCLLGKNLFYTIGQHFIPKFRKRVMNAVRAKKLKRLKVKKQWEKDYLLNDILKYHLMGEYMQMVIQYGFVIFFVAAFPLAPAIALLNNTLELRVDAQKLIKEYRRPVANKVASIGAWNSILYFVTFFGIITNAVIISFTSDFVRREVYRYKYNRNLRGYVDYTLSKFRISDFSLNFTEMIEDEFCYYPGKRYPPEHPRKYNLTEGYYYELTARFTSFVVIEHVFLIISGLLSYFIPSIPFSVKEAINQQKEKFLEFRKKALNQKYMVARGVGDQRRQKKHETSIPIKGL